MAPLAGGRRLLARALPAAAATRWSPSRCATCSRASPRGELRVVEGAIYPLSEARRAHEDLQGSPHVGKLVLDPAS